MGKEKGVVKEVACVVLTDNEECHQVKDAQPNQQETELLQMEGTFCSSKIPNKIIKKHKSTTAELRGSEYFASTAPTVSSLTSNRLAFTELSSSNKSTGEWFKFSYL